jgi:hypothetical protein
MNKMLPVKYITVHHDGMSSFTNTTKSAAASRLETIRRSHLRRDGGRWGDIGYHFAIDPSGRLWEGRPLAWQGAHVRARNEGNVGVVVLGNFEKQSVNRAQQGAVLSTIQTLMARFRVPLTRVRTHQEWAATACPGRSLQKVTTYRSQSMTASMHLRRMSKQCFHCPKSVPGTSVPGTSVPGTGVPGTSVPGTVPH